MLTCSLSATVHFLGDRLFSITETIILIFMDTLLCSVIWPLHLIRCADILYLLKMGLNI